MRLRVKIFTSGKFSDGFGLIAFSHLDGNYCASCCPFRVPVARLAAAKAKIKND